jgi:FkbM family methyltransferase
MEQSVSGWRRLLSTRGFQRRPIATTYRAVTWKLFHLMLKRKAVVRIPVNGTSFKLDLPPLQRQGGSAGVFLARQYYEPLLEYCHRVVKKGDVVFDVGANQGIYACAFAALVGPAGKVIAFEPQDYAIVALQNNARLNCFNHIYIRQVAVSDHEGSAVLDISAGAVSASIVRDFGHEEAIKVPTVTLTSVAEQLGLDRLDVIKMDIEGAELLALGGCKPLLERFKPTVVLEASPSEEQWHKIVALLADYGYDPHIFGVDGVLERIPELVEEYPNVVFIPRRH